VLLACLDLSLTKSSDTGSNPKWHPETVDQMRFGIDITPRRYDRELQLDLHGMRCYWSGEVLYDYVFFVANKHMYLGCLFCHPAHPFSKLERMCVCAIATCLILFPVAAADVAFGQSSAARLICMFVFATVPRNILRLYLVQVSQQDVVLEVESGQPQREARARRDLQWEFAFLGGCVVGTILTCLGCIWYIQSATKRPLDSLITANLDAIAFAFVLEPLLDVLFPLVGMGAHEGRWTTGFFGRWRAERDAFAGGGAAAVPAAAPGAKEAAAALPRTLEPNRGRPLYREVGAEILFGERGRPVRPAEPRGRRKRT